MGRTTATSDAKGRARLLARHRGERGFTLAGLIVILTIIALFIAYTVPTQWSKVLQREREKQTIFAMKQYARAIREWSKKNGNATPVKFEQLKEARQPRVIRGIKGEIPDPLTGEVDWIMVPPTAVTGATTPGATAGGMPGGTPAGQTSTAPSTSTTGTSGQSGTSFNPSASPKDYVGPFIGVRPAASGPSMLELNGNSTYQTWYYTTSDLDNEIQAATAVNPNAH